MKIIKRVISILVTIILLLILSFNLFNFISINVLGNELPTINGYALLEVISGSMEPKISIGDMVVIDTRVEKYKVNDIVTFKDINGSFVTHRILEINDEEVITKGDANNTIDELIDKDMIVGRYIYKINGVGALFKSLRSPFVLGMILVIGVLLCILVSTDSKGNAILTEEEKKYIEFLEYKNSKKKENIDTLKINKNVKKKIDTKTKKTNSDVKKTSSKNNSEINDSKKISSKGNETPSKKSKKNNSEKSNTASKKKLETNLKNKKETTVSKK